MKHYSSFILLLLSLLLFSALTEMGLRIAGYPPNPIVGWRTVHDVNRDDNPSRYYSRDEVNEFGYRGQSLRYQPGDVVTVLLGDSQVESDKSSKEEMPERFLEATLRRANANAKVISLGSAGYGQDQEFLALEEYFSRYPATNVVLWLTIGNDLWNNAFPSHSASGKEATPKPTYHLTSSGLVGPNRKIGDRLFRTQIEGLFFRGLYGDLHSYWERYLPAPYVPMLKPEAPYLEIVPTTEAIETEDSHWSIWLKPDSPRKLYAIALGRALLQKIADLCAAHGARLSVLEVNRWTPIGLEYLEKYPFFRLGQRLVEKDGKYFRADSEEYFRTLQLLTAGFDLVTIPVTVPNHVVSSEDPHFNAAGNRQVMEDLGEVLLKRGLGR